MGTYYALGVVKGFKAQTNHAISKDDWERILNERFDTELFHLVLENNSITATMKQGVFKENIEGLFQKLIDITGNKWIGDYFQEYGDMIENYPSQQCNFSVFDNDKNKIKLFIDFALIFIEGKVLAEQFATEPMLINWLFRHARFDNKLAGAIVSDIIG